jgi:hypothetical protein
MTTYRALVKEAVEAIENEWVNRDALAMWFVEWRRRAKRELERRDIPEVSRASHYSE